MGNLVEVLKANIDGVAVAAACLAVFLATQSVCPRTCPAPVVVPDAIYSLAPDGLSSLPGPIRLIRPLAALHR